MYLHVFELLEGKYHRTMALDIEPLDSSIREMLKKHESKSVIDQKLTSLYNPTGSQHWEDMDQLRYYDTMAKCYGVHYGHEDFSFVCNPPYCHFMPLLTAAHERKIELLRVLEHPDRQGYGIFKDDQIDVNIDTLLRLILSWKEMMQKLCHF